MKQAKRVAFGGMMAALAVAVMMAAYFPYLTFAVPCMAGLVSAVVAIELSQKWAYGVYAVSSVIVLLFAEPEAKILYVSFFGYYPVLKITLEKIRAIWLEYIVKFAVFNFAIIICYTVFASVFGVSMSDMGDFGKYTNLILLAVGNIVFFVYDILIDRLAGIYMYRFHNNVSKYLSR